MRGNDYLSSGCALEKNEAGKIEDEADNSFIFNYVVSHPLQIVLRKNDLY